MAHQNLVYSLEPQARGRLNALLFTGVFIGMALGSALGSQLYTMAGWPGVIALATLTAGVALIIRMTENVRTRSSACKIPEKKPNPQNGLGIQNITSFKPCSKGQVSYLFNWNRDIPCISLNAL